MLIAFSFFILIIAFTIYRIVNKEKHISQEKPLWKKIIYWEIILFLSIIFNIIMYAFNTPIYKLSTNIDNETINFLILLIAFCLIIQLISPSMLLGRLVKKIKTPPKKHTHMKAAEKSFYNEGLDDESISTHKDAVIYPVEISITYSDNLKDFQERTFELFLNTLCILSFSFVMFINVFFAIMPLLYGFDTSATSNFAKLKLIQGQMNYISCILLLLTLSIAIRQTIFYLVKLRKHNPLQSTNKESSSSQYERYMLVQKRLNKANDKL